jgi:hypothetical protein
MPDYSYDIFLSYKRDPWGIFDEWLTKHFIPHFMFKVGQAIAMHCGRPMTDVFFDQAKLSDKTRKLEGIEPGQEWQNALTEAIRQSRCIVALWSPEYFLSAWCLKEWNAFYHRKAELVIPVAVSDGDNFPVSAAKVQLAKKLSPYVIIGDGFKKSEKYVSFQEEITELAEWVGHVVKAAPPFADWPIVSQEDSQPPMKEEPIPLARL